MAASQSAGPLQAACQWITPPSILPSFLREAGNRNAANQSGGCEASLRWREGIRKVCPSARVTAAERPMWTGETKKHASSMAVLPGWRPEPLPVRWMSSHTHPPRGGIYSPRCGRGSECVGLPPEYRRWLLDQRSRLLQRALGRRRRVVAFTCRRLSQVLVGRRRILWKWDTMRTNRPRRSTFIVR